MDKSLMKEKEVERSKEVIEMDEILEADGEDGTIEVHGCDFKKYRDELFKKTNYVTALRKEVSGQIKQLNEKTNRIIQFRGLCESLQENVDQFHHQANLVGQQFNELHEKLSGLAEGTDFVDTGALLKLLNDYKTYDIDKSVFVEEITEIKVDTDYKG